MSEFILSAPLFTGCLAVLKFSEFRGSLLCSFVNGRGEYIFLEIE